MSTNKSGAERRKSRRRQILDTFSLFAVIPNKGAYRLPVHDVSDDGIGFDVDLDGEDQDAFPLKSGESLALHFYLNQSLYVPISVQVARIEQDAKTKVRRVGGSFSTKDSAGITAMRAFVQMLDQIASVAQVG